MALEDTSLLALLLTRGEISPQDVFPQFEKMRRKRVDAIVEAGRRQTSNKTSVSTIGMYIRNVFIYIFFHLVGASMVSKAWRYRIDWEESDVDKVVKWFKDGKLEPQ